MNANVISRAILIYEMVEKYYEPDRQNRCLLWCYRNIVTKKYPISERTFWRYMKIINNIGLFNYKKHKQEM